MYFTLFFHIVFYPNFYRNWLIWFADWYLQCLFTVVINQDENRLTMRLNEL